MVAHPGTNLLQGNLIPHNHQWWHTLAENLLQGILIPSNNERWHTLAQHLLQGNVIAPNHQWWHTLAQNLLQWNVILPNPDDDIIAKTETSQVTIHLSNILKSKCTCSN